MKWTCWIAALYLCCGTMTADAGLFGVFGKNGGCHDDSCCPTCAAPAECCPEEPTCCAPAECCPSDACCPAEPTCCAPAEPACCAPAECCPSDACCPAEPTCCAPAECCPAEPACCAPSECCETGCDNGCTSHSHCAPKRKGCLSRLFGMFKRNGHGCHKSSSCCEESCCPEPSCCAPVEPACCAPSGCH